MSAILEEPLIDDSDSRSQRRNKVKPDKTKPIPPHAVVVMNDDDHTFEYVIDVFQKIFHYDTQKAFLLAKEIHEKGEAIVWTGTKEVAELKEEQIRGMGPDFYAAPKKVDYPLRVEVRRLIG